MYSRCTVFIQGLGNWSKEKNGECVIVFQFSGYMLSLSFLVSVLSFSNQKPCVTNPMSFRLNSLKGAI